MTLGSSEPEILQVNRAGSGQPTSTKLSGCSAVFAHSHKKTAPKGGQVDPHHKDNYSAAARCCCSSMAIRAAFFSTALTSACSAAI